MSTATATYNDEIDATAQIDAEERIAAMIAGAQEAATVAGVFSWDECDTLGLSVLFSALGSFPTDYEIDEDDFKRVRVGLARMIYERQGGEAARVLGEEDCAQLSRDLLLEAVSFFRPDLVE